jgi:hypothetical protein
MLHSSELLEHHLQRLFCFDYMPTPVAQVRHTVHFQPVTHVTADLFSRAVGSACSPYRDLLTTLVV